MSILWCGSERLGLRKVERRGRDFTHSMVDSGFHGCRDWGLARHGRGSAGQFLNREFDGHAAALAVDFEVDGVADEEVP